jgi:carbon monoxide dehydrogenase subunit G
MIEADHTTTIATPIDAVWDYVRDIRRWANLFPGCRECTVLDAHDSQWVIKVGAGGLVKTVKVHVHVDAWAGPERVDFSYRLENEPVEGSGAYLATRTGAQLTGITLRLRVAGSGPTAPMWEAVSRPLLPQLAKAFASQLKAEIEQAAGIASPPRRSALTPLVAWLRRLWRILRPSPQPEHSP